VTAVPFRGILLDNHISEDLFESLERKFEHSEWHPWWLHLNPDVLILEALNLAHDSPDDLVWHSRQFPSPAP
jgi:hypothetical protein